MVHVNDKRRQVGLGSREDTKITFHSLLDDPEDVMRFVKRTRFNAAPMGLVVVVYSVFYKHDVPPDCDLDKMNTVERAPEARHVYRHITKQTMKLQRSGMSMNFLRTTG